MQGAYVREVERLQERVDDLDAQIDDIKAKIGSAQVGSLIAVAFMEGDLCSQSFPRWMRADRGLR